MIQKLTLAILSTSSRERAMAEQLLDKAFDERGDLTPLGAIVFRSGKRLRRDEDGAWTFVLFSPFSALPVTLVVVEVTPSNALNDGLAMSPTVAIDIIGNLPSDLGATSDPDPRASSSSENKDSSTVDMIMSSNSLRTLKAQLDASRDSVQCITAWGDLPSQLPSILCALVEAEEVLEVNVARLFEHTKSQTSVGQMLEEILSIRQGVRRLVLLSHLDQVLTESAYEEPFVPIALDQINRSLSQARRVAEGGAAPSTTKLVVVATVRSAREEGFPLSLLSRSSLGQFHLHHPSSSSATGTFLSSSSSSLSHFHPSQVTGKWKDLSELIGVDRIVQTIFQSLLRPLWRPQLMRLAGLLCPKGALLYGPSGSGKTVLMKAIAKKLHETVSSVHVILQDALALMEKEVGSTEKKISELMMLARAKAPCVILLDNLDAIAPPRHRQRDEGNNVSDRTLSTLLTELDGVRDRHGASVMVVASAPTLEDVDPAATRAGRLDLHLALQLPSPEDCAKYFFKLLSPMTVLATPPPEEVMLTVTSFFRHCGRNVSFADVEAAATRIAVEQMSLLEEGAGLSWDAILAGCQS